MQALVNTRLANIGSTVATVRAMQTKTSSGSTTAKTAAKGFLAVLLSALSAWGA